MAKRKVLMSYLPPNTMDKINKKICKDYYLIPKSKIHKMGGLYSIIQDTICNFEVNECEVISKPKKKKPKILVDMLDEAVFNYLVGEK